MRISWEETYVIRSLEIADLEKKECAADFVSSMVQQLLKYMTSYKQPLEKVLLWNAGGVQGSKDG
jgi:hypothetical protein